MTRFNELIVGIVFFSAIAVLGYYTIIRGEMFDTRKFVYSTVIFEDVEGLTLGNKVLVNGVESGSVSSIELMVDGKVIVSLKLYRFFSMYENYRIVLKNQSALGGKIIVINTGSAEAGGEVFEPVESMNNLKGITLGDPLTKLAEIIDENRDDLRTTIKNISEFTAKINSGNGTIAKLINQDTVHEETGKLLQELRDTVEDSREQAPVTSFIRAALTAF